MLKYYMVYNLFRKKMDKAVLAIIAIVAVVGLLGVAVVEGDNIIKQIQAFAKGCENGLPNSAFGLNASKGRCFGH
jgi:hypothetical protein